MPFLIIIKYLISKTKLDSNGIQTHKHLVPKRTLNHLA